MQRLRNLFGPKELPQPKSAREAFDRAMNSKDVQASKKRATSAEKDYENAVAKGRETDIATAKLRKDFTQAEFQSTLAKSFKDTGFIDKSVTPQDVINAGKTAGSVAKDGPENLPKAVENDPNMKSIDSMYQQIAKSTNNKVNSTPGANQLLDQKLGKAKSKKALETIKIIAGLGAIGSIVGVFFVMAEKNRKEGSGCFMRNTETGEDKKCNVRKDDDSCNGCDGNTCGDDKKCGETCDCKDAKQTCFCQKLSFLDAMGNTLDDIYKVAKEMFSPIGNILAAIGKYFPYVVITVGVIIALLVVVKIVGAFKGSGGGHSGRQIVEIQTKAVPSEIPQPAAPETAPRLSFGSRRRSRRFRY